MNDNGINPNEPTEPLEFAPKMSRRRKRKIAILVVLAAFLFVVPMSIFAVIGFAHVAFNRTRTVEMVVEPPRPAVETPQQAREYANERAQNAREYAREHAQTVQNSNLQRLSPNNLLTANSHSFAIADFNELRVSAEFGAVELHIVNGQSDIIVAAANNFRFSTDNGVLDITAPANAGLSIWLPQPTNAENPLFDNVHINAEFGYVQIVGSNDTYFAENLSISSEFNAIQLFDLQISGILNLSAEFGSIQLVQVTANPNNFTFNNGFGSTSIFETWDDFQRANPGQTWDNRNNWNNQDNLQFWGNWDEGQITWGENGDVTIHGRNPTQATMRPFFGVIFQTVDENQRQRFSLPSAGAIILEVTPNSPAEQAGVLRSDLIVGFNGNPITGYQSFLDAIWDSEIGEEVVVTLYRNGSERLEIPVTLSSTFR